MALLARIAAADGGGGGTSCFQCSSGAGAPAAPPAVTTQPASYEDTTNDFTYNWDVPTQQWIPVPKVYRALLTQTGTDAPVATVLENTLGGLPVWSYDIDGTTFIITLAGAFPTNKTFPVGGFTNTLKAVGWVVGAGGQPDSLTFSADGDDTWQNTVIEILVYP